MKKKKKKKSDGAKSTDGANDRSGHLELEDRAVYR
jgi:hypothetical protein